MEKPDAWFLTDVVKHESGRGDPFAAAIRATRMPMVISNPRLPDNPLVFANDAFSTLTGYPREDILGKNCRFLQGPGTNPMTVQNIRESIHAGVDATAELLNYRKDGSTFWNALYMSPVFNEAGELLYFFASQLDVTRHYDRSGELLRQRKIVEQEVEARTAELNETLRRLQLALDTKDVLLHEVDHRVKNNLQMVSSLIMMQIGGLPDEETRAPLRAMLDRVQALGAVHRRLHQSSDVSMLGARGLVDDLVAELQSISGRDEIRVVSEVDDVEIDATRATPVALLVNELMTNSLKHAFPNGRRGEVKVSLRRTDEAIELSVADDGAGSAGAPAGFGSRLITTLARQLHGRLEQRANVVGTATSITFPATARRLS